MGCYLLQRYKYKKEGYINIENEKCNWKINRKWKKIQEKERES